MATMNATPVTTSHATEVYDSASTSVNGSISTNDTAHTETSSVTAESTKLQDTQSSPKSAGAAPKVNPWKVRADQHSGRASATNGAISRQAEPFQEKSAKVSQPARPQAEAPIVNSASQKKSHRVSKSVAPSIEDAALWPSLDMAAEDKHEQKKNAEQVDGNTAPSAPKPTGKEKWTKYTPTITYSPIPSKVNRAGGSGNRNGRGGSGARTGGRDKTNAENAEHAHDGTHKSSRTSETSRSRVPKSRSMSVSNAHIDAVPRRNSRQGRDIDSQTVLDRSQSSKRSDRGSISAPPHSSQNGEASSISKTDTATSFASDTGSPTYSEHRAQRSSYDSAFNSRGRGGYRSGRANYHSSYNNRYQNPGFIQQNYQTGRVYSQRETNPYGYDQFPNFVNPSLAPMMVDPRIAHDMVLKQCEYYFSIENLCKDLFLRKHMDDEGFVNLTILANFNRLRSITIDYALIRDVCFGSSVIELRAAPGAYDKVRRAEGWAQWVLPEEQRDASIRQVPQVPEMPRTAHANGNGENGQDMNVGARSFIPGQQIADSQPLSTGLNENLEKLSLVGSLVAGNGTHDISITEGKGPQ